MLSFQEYRQLCAKSRGRMLQSPVCDRYEAELRKQDWFYYNIFLDLEREREDAFNAAICKRSINDTKQKREALNELLNELKGKL